MSDQAAFESIAERVVLGGRLQATTRLHGGVSAIVHRLDVIDRHSQHHRFVVRQRIAHSWKDTGHTTAATEFRLLQVLHATGQPVPMPILVDDSCIALPSPYYVMAFVDGSTTLEPRQLGSGMRAMAEFLATLHRVDASIVGELDSREDPLVHLDRYLPAGTATQALLAAIDHRPTASTPSSFALLHGDYWPGNVLWRNGRIAAVLDWEDAAIGDPASDVACCRVELFVAYGEAAVDEFTRQYQQRHALALDRIDVWGVYVAATALASMDQWGLDADILAHRRRRTAEFLDASRRRLVGES